MSKGGFVAICTASDVELLTGDFERLEKSLVADVDQLYLIRRITGNMSTPQLSQDSSDRVTVVDSGPLSLSEARNLGLGFAERGGWLTPATVIAFPDDDCVYPPGLVASVRRHFSENGCDFLATPYAPSARAVDRKRFPESREWLTARGALRQVASAGLFVRADWFRQIGNFDPRLGVGTPLGSGEEVDLVFRLLRSGARGLYLPEPVILHPYALEEDLRRLPARFALLWSYRKDLQLNRTLMRSLAGQVKLSLRRPDTIHQRWSAVGQGLLAAVGETRAGLTEHDTSSYDYELFHCLNIPRSGFQDLPVSNLPVSDLLDLAVSAFISGLRRPLLLAAAHITALNSSRSPRFRADWAASSISYCDGISALLVSRLGGASRAERMATTDLVPELLKLLALKGVAPRVAIIGGEYGVARRAEPAVSGYGCTLIFAEHGYHTSWQDVLAELRDAEPDVVIVGMGMPLELEWCVKHASELPHSILVTCGGWLRLLAGMEERSPLVMQKLRLEWAYRWVSDPKRVSRRYITGIRRLAYAVPKAIFGRRRRE